jgi:integrase/recombinase XerC
MLDSFFSYLQFEKRFSVHTLEAYSSDLKQFMAFLEVADSVELLEVSPIEVRSWVVAMVDEKNAHRSINRKLATLRTFYKWLQKEGKITHSPLQKINGPKSEKRLPIFIREADLEQTKIDPLFDDSFEGHRDHLMVEIFYQTGVRLSELIHLRGNDVRPESIKVLGKRNKERLIPISSKLFSEPHGLGCCEW